MPLSEIILIIMALLTVSMLAAGLCRNMPIPYTVFLVILGIILGRMARTIPEMEMLMEFQLTPDLVLFLFLPALIFESAFNLDARKLVNDLAPILTLAVPALLISTAFIGTGLWLILGIDFSLALLFGALISATDPVAVIALFKELGAPERLTILVEGESLLNDATAIVVFHIILGLVISGSFALGDAGLAVLEFLYVFLGGALVGAVIGFAISELFYKFFSGLSAFMIMSIVVAYASFIIAEHNLHVSGVMAVVAAAVTIGILWVPRISQSATHVVKETWEVIALVSNSLLFLLVGLSIEIGRLMASWYIILAAVILVLLARATTIYSLVPATIKMFSLPHVTMGERHIMWWGGLKGGLAIAIVLSVPIDLPGRELLLDLTLGTVIFSLLINAPTIRPLIQKIGLDRLTHDERSELKQGLIHAGQESGHLLEHLYKHGLITRASEQIVRRKTEEIFTSDVPEIEKEHVLRHLYLVALRREFDELKHLHDIGLLEHYAFLGIRNTLQRDRARILMHQSDVAEHRKEKKNIFIRLEEMLLKNMREYDWAAWLLTRYQNTRMAQSMQRDIASILMSTSVLEMLDKRVDLDTEAREEVAEKYRNILRIRKSQLENIASDFPDFYSRFEINLFTRVAFSTARYFVGEDHHDGEIGAKAYGYINRLINQALSELPKISEPARQLDASELIATIPLLQDLSEETLQNLSNKATAVTFLQGDTVIGEGERGDALYIITKGMVNVYNQEEMIAELSIGDFFGERALLGDHLRTATVKAKNTCTLLRLKRKDVLQFAEHDTDLKNRLENINRLRQAHSTLIGNVPLLKGLSTDVLEVLAGEATTQETNANELVIQEGERGDALYIIMHGDVSIYKNNQFITELHEGDFFGEMALLGDQIRTATVKTMTPASFLVLTRDNIRELTDNYPELEERLNEEMQNRQV